VEITKLLFDSGTCIKTPGLLEYAAKTAHRNGHIDFISFLYPDASSVTDTEDSLWFWTGRLLSAARDGDAETVKQIVERDEIVVGAQENGPTALQLAIDGDHVDVVNCLIQTGKIEMNAKTKLGQPLSKAITEERIGVVRALVEAPVDLHRESRLEYRWISYLDLAIAQGNKSIIKIIEEKM
jgi:hypothetical protein